MDTDACYQEKMQINFGATGILLQELRWHRDLYPHLFSFVSQPPEFVCCITNYFISGNSVECEREQANTVQVLYIKTVCSLNIVWESHKQLENTGLNWNSIFNFSSTNASATLYNYCVILESLTHFNAFNFDRHNFKAHYFISQVFIMYALC